MDLIILRFKLFKMTNDYLKLLEKPITSQNTNCILRDMVFVKSYSSAHNGCLDAKYR